MLKLLADSVFSFDVEWIPDPQSAEILHQTERVNEPGPLAEASFEALWSAARKEGDPEDFQPYLKTILCRIVSLAGILREKVPGGAELKLISLPTDRLDFAKSEEKALIVTFLKSVGRKKPQLVGYNSAQADVPIIVQRAIVHGLPGFGFSDRPDKPWLGVDYFDARNSEYNVDLADAMGQYRDRPSLHQAATLSGIPGKIEVSGDSVARMWAEGKLEEIVAYNEFDAFTTHLLWARVAHFSGLLSSEEYGKEQELVRTLLQSEIESGKEHLQKFINEWDRLQEITGQNKSQ
jgi:predicted PolB exonuclease-like 3'-5' exonuclease